MAVPSGPCSPSLHPSFFYFVVLHQHLPSLPPSLLEVVIRVWGYRKVWLQSNKVFETGFFSLPPLEYGTRALFIDIDGGMKKEVGRNEGGREGGREIRQRSQGLTTS